MTILRLAKEPHLGDRLAGGWWVVAVSRPDRLVSVARLGDSQDCRRWRVRTYEVAV